MRKIMPKTSKKRIIILAVCFIIFLTQAKDINSFTLAEPTQLETMKFEFIPKYPGANTKVQVKIITFSFDPDISHITWTLNGEIIEQGRGKKMTEFKTGNIGSTVSLSAYVITEKGRETQKSIKFTIGEINLLWQALTYTPPFYKAKAKPTTGSTIKVAAIPEGLGSNKNNLVFDWRRNYKNQPEASGLGRDAFIFSFSDIFNEEIISVKISDIKKSFFIEKTVKIKAERPIIVFYEDHPLKGPLYEKALSKEINLEQSEISLRAEPYFFPNSDLSSLSYNWTMNKKTIEPLSLPNIIGLTHPQTKGYSIIQLEVKNPQKLLQQAINSLRINL